MNNGDGQACPTRLAECMDDSQPLSSLQDLPRPPIPVASARVHARALLFDACQLGVVLRAVLFVEAVMAVGAIFGAAGFVEWVEQLAVFSGAALPGVLSWLIVACTCKRLVARLPPTAQHVFGVALGAVAGLYGCALLALVGAAGHAPWVAS